MKKKAIIIPAICLAAAVSVALAVLLFPVPGVSYDDGGTREYNAVLYKIVSWNRLDDDLLYDEVRFYFGDDRKKSIDELWEIECPGSSKKLTATVTEISGDTVIVEPLEQADNQGVSGKISFSVQGFEDIGAQPGDVVSVSYTGEVMETCPAQINALGWEICNDFRFMEYDGEWIDKLPEEKVDYEPFSDIVITRIYSDCFFATPVIPMPYEIKLNGTLSDDWCVGDQVICTYENAYYSSDEARVEADMLSIEISDFELDPYVSYKPVIYLYPEKELDVSVKLRLDGALTCTYPLYNDGWQVTAQSDGTLTDSEGQSYNYLYWEGDTYAEYDLSKGFCVRGEDTASFLEDALSKLGLNRREANEFIVYWLPLMEQNPYNIISFQTDAYTDAAQLEIAPTPDTLIRVFMAWQACDEFVSVEEQILTAPERSGFTAVEWGGTEIK